MSVMGSNIITSFKFFDYRAPNSANLNDDNGDFSITIHNEDLITHPHSSVLELRGKLTVTTPGAPALGNVPAVPPAEITSLDFSKIKLATAGWYTCSIGSTITWVKIKSIRYESRV